MAGREGGLRGGEEQLGADGHSGSGPAGGSAATPLPGIAVVGLGNVLCRDDGFGPTAVRMFEASYRVGEDVALRDMGTPGADLAPLVGGLRALLVLDTVATGAPPGTVRVLRGPALLEGSRSPRIQPHEPSLVETLRLLELEGRAPGEVMLIGVVPERVSTGVGLSRRVREAIPVALAAVVGELEGLGSTVEVRPVPAEPDLWWSEPGMAVDCQGELG